MTRRPTEPVRFEGRPTQTGTAGAVVGCLVVVGIVAGSATGLVAAVFGTGCVCAGLWRARQSLVTLGSGALFLSVLAVGISHNPLWLLWATTPVVLLWGVARHAVRLGRQVGQTGATHRVELVRSVSIAVIVVVGGGIGYVGFQSISGSVSLLAVVLLFAGVVAVALALR